MKRVYTLVSLLILTISTIQSSAQLNCTGASAISCGQNITVPAAAPGAPNNITNYPCSQWGEEGPERVFTYTPTVNGPIAVKISGFNMPTDDLEVIIMGACTNGSACLGQVFSDSAYYANGVAGTLYYIVVDSDNGSSAGCNMYIHCPPSNCTINTNLNSVTAETAVGANDGVAVVSVGGSPDFTLTFYTLSGTSLGSGVLANNLFTLSNLAPGTYYAEAIDQQNNTCKDTVQFTVLSATGANCTIATTATATNETAEDAANGTATVTVTGAIGPYTVEWSNGQILQTISGLAPGAYSVTATDSAGCAANTQVTVLAYQDTGGTACSIFVTTFTTNETAENANNGTATAIVFGSNGGTTYQWSDGATVFLNINLAPGVYSVTVSDSTGCVDSATVEIFAFGDGEDSCEFSIQVSTDDISAPGATDGSAQVQVDGPDGTYYYSWNTGISAPVIYGLGAGSYIVTVTDSTGCTVTGLALISFIPVGVTEIESQASMRLYPNPAINEINMVLQHTVKARVNILNTLGELVYSTSERVYTQGTPYLIALEHLPKGIYFLELKGSGVDDVKQVFILR